MNSLPKGKYYIGDPCYVLGTKEHKDWLAILDKTNYFDGNVYELDSHKVWAHGTAHGDGYYMDNLGNGYGVDAGLIGAIPVELVRDMEDAVQLGHIHDFEDDFTCTYKNGTLNFGDLVIVDTDPQDTDDEA